MKRQKLHITIGILGIAVAVGISISSWWALITYRQPLEVTYACRETDSVSGENYQSGSKVVVSVLGAVASPGVYALPQGSRWIDAVVAAGGFDTTLADEVKVSQSINVAEVLVPDQKIYVPLVGDSDQISSKNNGVQNPITEKRISINSASKSELQTLDGIGEVRAENIIQNRPCTSIDQLVEKTVLSLTQLDKMRDAISL